MSECVRLGAGAGFAGDRMDAANAMATAGDVDVIVLECLAERTLIEGLGRRAEDPTTGFDKRLNPRLSPLLCARAAGGPKVISNLGGCNPEGAALATARLCQQLGLAGLRIAVVLGDDLIGTAKDVDWGPRGDGSTGPLPDNSFAGPHQPDPAEAEPDWLGVHAYLGAAQIAEAFDAGADIVLTGRVADSALFAGPALAVLGNQHLPAAMTVGHLLECSGQLTGGNVEGPGLTPSLNALTLAMLAHPVATLRSDGDVELALQSGRPGRLDRMSATLQLLYEVHDPSRYITPDGVLDFANIQFSERAENVLAVSGFRMQPAPEQLKVVGFRAPDGVVADIEIGFAGSGARGRAELAAETLELRLDQLGLRERRVDLVGLNSVLAHNSDFRDLPLLESRVHVSAYCGDAVEALAVEDEVFALTLSGPAGGCSLKALSRPVVRTLTGSIDRERVPARFELLEV